MMRLARPDIHVLDKFVDVGQPSGLPLRHDSRERDISETVVEHLLGRGCRVHIRQNPLV
jgi:hypothetical protein